MKYGTKSKKTTVKTNRPNVEVEKTVVTTEKKAKIGVTEVLIVLLVFGISTPNMRQSDREKARAGEEKTEEIVQSPKSIDDGESEYATVKDGQENNEEAANPYLKAAEQGDALAQYNLGAMYRDGEGVEQDYGKAIKWYLEAAWQGHNKAKVNLVWTVILRLV